MYIDFILNEIDINENESKIKLREVLSPGRVDSVTVPFYLIKPAKSVIEELNSHSILSCLIDYPLGISDLKTRQFAVGQAIKAGVNMVDVVMPQNLATNRKYDKIREDVKTIVDICKEANCKLRYNLEYRFFDHHCLKKLCEIFDDFGVNSCVPSTGYFIDNLADNIIASIFLYQNSKDIQVLTSGNFWVEHHFDTLNKSGISGFRTNSSIAILNYLKYDSLSK
jgi:deoxyribose-phosphate aldolase